MAIAIPVAFAVLVLDMLTKWLVLTRMSLFQEIPIIPGFFSLQFVYNPGAAFGILANQRWLFIVIALIAVGVMLTFLRQPEGKQGLVPWALGCLMGGTLGNMVDRVRFGDVVDFFLFYWREWSFPNFNVADIGITVGVGLFILYMLITGEKKPREGA